MIARCAPAATLGILCGLMVGALLTLAAILHTGQLPAPVALLSIHLFPAALGALLGATWELEP